MKRTLGLVLVWLCGVACACAQTDGTVPVNPEPIKIMGEEAVGMQETIRGYMQGAMHRGRLELYDRKKGKNVILQLDRIVIDDPARVVFPQLDQVAICGECTEIASVKDEQRRNPGEGHRRQVRGLVPDAARRRHQLAGHGSVHQERQWQSHVQLDPGRKWQVVRHAGAGHSIASVISRSCTVGLPPRKRHLGVR